jgi:hypothetical protein
VALATGSRRDHRLAPAGLAAKRPRAQVRALPEPPGLRVPGRRRPEVRHPQLAERPLGGARAFSPPRPSRPSFFRLAHRVDWPCAGHRSDLRPESRPAPPPPAAATAAATAIAPADHGLARARVYGWAREPDAPDPSASFSSSRPSSRPSSLPSIFRPRP